MTQDVVVVGGGVSGLSIALHLRLLGVSRVTVLERHHTGAGQSGRAAGVIRALVKSPAVASILMESLHFFKTFEQRFDEKMPYREPGYLLVSDAESAETMDHAIRSSGAAGCEAARITSQEARELQPGLRCSSDDVYAFEPAAVHVDAMLATQVLTRVARRMGVHIEGRLRSGGHSCG